MNDWGQRLRATRLDFIDRLERHGFTRATENVWQGGVASASGSRWKVQVCLGDGWPYHPPLVLPLDNEHADSWHRDPTGGLCLYVDDDRTDRPWLDVDTFLARIAAWFDNAEAGWPDDTPDMDLERYFDPARPRLLVVYDELAPLLGRSIRTKRGRNNTVEIVGAAPASRKAKRREFRFGYCADLGTPEKPPKTWGHVEALIPNGADVAKGIRDGRYPLLILRYFRGGQEGVVALSAWATKDDEIVLKAHQSASASLAVRALRAGPQASALAGKRVAVVGCGAVGSFVAEGLARSGVSELTLQDGDVLRPGNLVRHVASETEVGLSKPDAVWQALESRGLLLTDPRSVSESLLDPAAARALLDEHDLVIDATADGAATTLLRHAAEDAGSTVLSVCTQNEGDTVRMDLLPPLNGASPLPATVQREPRQPIVYEGGCGDPVSPTAPHAVIEAAALAVRHACALLLGSPLDDAGEVREHPRPDDD